MFVHVHCTCAYGDVFGYIYVIACMHKHVSCIVYACSYARIYMHIHTTYAHPNFLHVGVWSVEEYTYMDAYVHTLIHTYIYVLSSKFVFVAALIQRLHMYMYTYIYTWIYTCLLHVHALHIYIHTWTQLQYFLVLYVAIVVPASTQEQINKSVYAFVYNLAHTYVNISQTNPGI
jgi:hypothetical protein